MTARPGTAAVSALGEFYALTLDTAADWEQYMRDTFPKALGLLKELCERPAA